MVRSCSIFHCDRRGGRYCCADCPDPCDNRCLNHPDRCRLVKDTPPKGPKYDPIPPEKRSLLVQLLKEGTLARNDIAKQVGCSVGTVSRYKDILKRGDSL